MTQPEAKSKMPGATYGAKEKDCPPVKAAKKPKSHAANLEGWKDVHRIELSYAETPYLLF